MPWVAAGMAAFEANEKYHEYRDKGLSVTDSFIRSGIDTLGSFVSVGMVDNLSDRLILF
ncbi:MAG: hypothetical protein GXO62_03180 [Epsilonproteobacteria bacterium]|nr:hypothetical protein [Campylobacterota bacterium]